MDALCPFCNARADFKFRAKDLNNRITEEPFNCYKCLACGLVYLAPVPADLARYYRSNYIAYDIPASLKQLEAKAEQVRCRIDMVQQYAPQPGRLLEIGPSYGGFAFLAKKAGFSVDVVEMDAECCRFLKDVVGVNAICADNVRKTLAGLGQYDVIALWHVIEHFAEPWKVLEDLAEHLSPDGITVLSTPNPDSLQFKLFGRFWVHLDAPRHLNIIPAALLMRQMHAPGLTCLCLTTAGRENLGLNSFGWAASLKNIFEHKPLQYAAHLAGRLLSKVFLPVERRGLCGSTYTLIFQKTGAL